MDMLKRIQLETMREVVKYTAQKQDNDCRLRDGLVTEEAHKEEDQYLMGKFYTAYTIASKLLPGNTVFEIYEEDTKAALLRLYNQSPSTFDALSVEQLEAHVKASRDPEPGLYYYHS